MAERGEIALGGCCIEDDQPDMVCSDCHQGYKKSIPNHSLDDIFQDLLAGCGDEPTEGNGDEDAAMDLLTDDFGKLDAKVMGVYGAMVRGLSKKEALKKYGLTEQEYEDGYHEIFSEND
ncbi:MAG: hypothetical protein NC391_09290 [Alistipes timonensis]|nr:hypothetical protein [Alistipes timonensis]